MNSENNPISKPENFDAVLQIVQRDGLKLLFASDELKNNREIITAAFQNNVDSFMYASSEAQNDTDFIHHLINLAYSNDIQGQILSFTILNHASKNIKNDEKIIRRLIPFNGEFIDFASDEIRSNLNIVKLAIAQNPNAFRSINPKFKDDFHLVKKVVSRAGSLIQYASDRLKNNKELAKIAINNNTLSLNFLPHFNNDRELALIALNKDGFALKYLCNEFKNDKELALIALKQNKNAITLLSPELKSLCKEADNPITALEDSITKDKFNHLENIIGIETKNTSKKTNKNKI